MSATEQHSTPEPQSLDAGTEYVVLQRVDVEPGKKAWLEVGKSNARSADAALKITVGKLPEQDRQGTFIATPARSFKPVTVSEKVERTLVIGS